MDAITDAYDLVGNSKGIYPPGLSKKVGSEDERGASLFYRNEDGTITFTEKEAERASDYIASIGLDERVKASLQKKRFVLPQKTDKVEANFCNESVYGSVNVLWVSGVIRMEEGTRNTVDSAVAVAPTSTNQTFDVWPSPTAKARMKKTQGKIAMHAEMYDSYGRYY